MDRITRYGHLKTRSREMAGYINGLREPKKRPDIERLHSALVSCADYLVFHDYYTVEELRLVKAHTCKKHLLCPFCARRRAAKMVEKNLPKIETALASQKALKPVMITFTVKNGDNLRERFNHIRKAVGRLMEKRRNCYKGQKWTEFAKVAGGIASYEFTKYEDKGWHPHVHMICLLTDWIDQKALSEEWHDITGDSFIVDIRRIKPRDGGAGGVDIASGLLEVCKYALKFQDLTLPDTWHAFETLRTRRLVQGFGCLHGIEVPDKLLDDPLEALPYLELSYQYRTRIQAYDLVETKKVEV